MIDTPNPSANELERQHQLDEALDESYPASDPVAVGTDRREREKRIERDKAEKTDRKISKVDIDESAIPQKS